MDLKKIPLDETSILYYLAAIFIFYIVLANLMILRAHLFIALALGVGASYYLTKQAKERKFFD